MVSFQCEGCGDTLKKPKLDQHRNHCRGASFSCLDCMTHFHGTGYRSHTSCMTEDQKYQGALYREKPSKAAKRKSVSIVEPNEQNALVPRQAYVEDAPDVDVPHAPSPPPAVQENVNVFDFLVTEDSPRASKTSLTNGKRQSAPVSGSKSTALGKENMQNEYRNSEETLHSREYEEQGFSYGAEPVNPRPFYENNGSLLSLDFMTPAAKVTRAKLDKKDRSAVSSHSRNNSGSTSVGKRKRGNTDEHANGGSYEIDTPMPDVTDDPSRSNAETPLALTHSGLTGGLTRLLSHPDNEFPFPPSPEAENERHRNRTRGSQQSSKHDDPPSPLKRTRHSREESSNGLGISIKGRAGKVMSMVGAAFNPAAANNEGLRRESSDRRDKDRDGRKKHRVQRHNGTSSANVRYERSSRSSRRRGSDQSPEAQRRKVKAIEYHQPSPDNSDSDSDDIGNRGRQNGQMVVFGAEQHTRARCESFLSYVTKGPDSEKGCSINKALKRWHRDTDTRSSHGKIDQEKELWRGLRLKRNERGEIVLFF